MERGERINQSVAAAGENCLDAFRTQVRRSFRSLAVEARQRSVRQTEKKR